jgi:hypothetical protein
MTQVKVRNTESNKNHLSSIGRFFVEDGAYLVISLSDREILFFQHGQLTVSSFKKNILGL